MAVNKRIDQLPTGTEVNSNSILPIWNNNNTTEGVNIDIVSDYMVGDLESVVYRTNQLLSGGASFLSGLTYDVTSLEYLINGEIYTTSTSTTVTTSTGDTTYDRIDLIIADTNGDVTILEGTASENPVQPDVDETTQIIVAIITVPAGVTVITVEETLVYDENDGWVTEWSGTTSTGTIDLEYTTYVKSGSKSIFFNVVPNLGQTTFRSQSPFDTTTQNTIQFWIRNTVAWTTQQRLNIRLQNTTGTNIGTVVQLFNGKYGFAVGTGSVGVWQLISIPIADFNLPTSIISRIQFQSSVTSGVGLSCIIDLIKFTEGSITNSQTNKWWYVRGNTSTTITPGTLNSTLRLEGVNNINSYSSGTNKILFDINPVVSGLTSVEATTFYGDGSNLTGISSGPTLWTGGTGVDSIISLNQSHSAIGDNSFIAGGQANSATTSSSAVVGGSGNLVNSISSFIGGGYNNSVGVNNYSSIIGGSNNQVDGGYSSIIGGIDNIITNYSNRSAISGGWGNNVGAESASITGGKYNTTTGPYSFIAGGQNNLISSTYSSVIGGSNNITRSSKSSIIGGEYNTLTGGSKSTILGGSYNNVFAGDSSIIGGSLNIVTNSSSSSFIGGGQSNNISGQLSTIIGGSLNNIVTGTSSSIIGGMSNSSSGYYSAIVGGNGNQVSSYNSFIGGGNYNNTSSYNTVIIGGYFNTANAHSSAVIGGGTNTASGPTSAVIGGGNNTASQTNSAVVGGGLNTSSGPGAFIGGGYGNQTSGSNSAIIGGLDNSITYARSVVIGGQLNTSSSYNSFIGGGDRNRTSAINSAVIGGSGNTVSGSHSVILGGQNITGLTQNTVYVPTIHATQIPAYDDDTAAGIGGLTIGKFYQTTGSGAAPLNVPGILMIKQ